MKLAIYNHGIAFDGSTPFNQPLGGSESGIVYMARELAGCGHDVTVYCNLPANSEHRGVPAQLGTVPVSNTTANAGGQMPKYRHYHEFFTDYVSARWDAVISFRSFDPFLLGRVAPRMIFWTGDAFDQPGLKNFGHESLQANVDLILCVSNWHRDTFIKTFQLPPDKVVATRNGFNSELIRSSETRDWARAAYSSTPFRGLDLLLKMFPAIRRDVPEFKLDVFSSMKVYGWTSDQDQRAFGTLYDAAAEAGVNWHGSLSQPALLEHLGRSGLFLYPNTFDETSCIAAIEAQASGCVVITSAKAALIETVEHGRTGILVTGDPKSEEYQRDFITTACALMQNRPLLRRFSQAAQERAFQKYTWSSIAREWTGILESMRCEPVHARLSGPLTLLQKTHDYLRNGNRSAAARVLAALDQTPFLRSEVEALKGQLGTWM
jgi:glycosyltransferase involved in cell wall biosynthesis